MIDKVLIIQGWFKGLKVVWANRATLAKQVAAARIIQIQARKLLEKVHIRKMSEMQESFVFFGQLRSKCILDSQIKLAYLWRKIVKLRKKRIEDAIREEERIKAEKLARKKNKRTSYGQAKRPKAKKKANKDLEVAGGVSGAQKKAEQNTKTK